MCPDKFERSYIIYMRFAEILIEFTDNIKAIWTHINVESLLNGNKNAFCDLSR